MNPLILGAAALALVGLVKSASAKAGASSSSQKMPDALRTQLADVLIELGYENGQDLTGTPTPAAVQKATLLASTLADLGYSDVASYLREKTEAASKKIATPKTTVKVSASLPADVRDKIQRILAFERDPVKLRQAAAWLRQTSKTAEAAKLAAMLDEMAIELEQQKVDLKTQVAVDQVMKGETPIEVTAPSVPVRTQTTAAKTVVAPPPVVQTAAAFSSAAATIASQLGTLPTLRYGSKGPAVGLWQTFLGIPADNSYGPASVKATQAWQRANGLTADGVVGRGTWAKAAASATTQAASMPVPGLVPGSTVADVAQQVTEAAVATAEYNGIPAQQIATQLASLPTIYQGSQGEAVKLWQRFLGITPDGNFGSGTKAKTVAWQKSQGFSGDGVVGRNSWAKAASLAGIVQQVATQAAPLLVPTATATPVASPAQVSPAQQIASQLGGLPTLYQGSVGEAVKLWQRFLGLTPDGNFGSGTKAKTVAWQKSQGFSGDGVVGRNSWTRAASLANQVSGVEPPRSSKAQKLADAVARHLLSIQRAHGMPGAKDKADTTLIKRYQEAIGVTQDGRMGPGATAKLAELGQVTLPLVMHWPARSGAKALEKYRQSLYAIASRYSESGDDLSAEAIRSSATLEKGQAAGGLE